MRLSIYLQVLVELLSYRAAFDGVSSRCQMVSAESKWVSLNLRTLQKATSESLRKTE